MRKLDSEMMYFLRKDAKMIKDTRLKLKEAKEIYKPEIASSIALKEINSIRSSRENYKKSINNLVSLEMKKVKEEHENQYRSEGHQATISNIIKMLELRDFNVNEDQFKNLVAPLVKANDYITLELLADIMSSKEQYNLSDYCKENANKNEVESTEKLLNAISEYINTDILKAVGGDPLKYKNSSYDEVCILAENLGFDISDMTREYGGGDILVDKQAFMQRQVDVAFGLPVEEPIFKIDDKFDIEK